MEHFVIIVNGFQPLTIIAKYSILDVVAVLDPPLIIANFSILDVWRIMDTSLGDVDEKSSSKKLSLFQAKRIL